MKFYYCIKLAGFFSGLMVICFFYLFTIFGQDPSVKSKNIEAEIKFLKWEFNNNPKISGSLKNIVNVPTRLEYIAQESQLDFDTKIDQSDINKKIQEVNNNFITKFSLKNLSKQEESDFKNLLRLLVEPEFSVFGLSMQNKSTNDQTYKSFIESLSKYKTPINTTLEDWALRYLTSEVLIIGLPMIEKFEKDKKFNTLETKEKQNILSSIAKIVTEQFITNLKGLEDKYKFKAPSNIADIIHQKISLFLNKKFQN